jgi:hypothetical protein
MQDVNNPLNPHHELSIISPKVTESLGLLMKDIEDRVNRLTGSEPVEDLMLDQVGPCSALKFPQSSLEERIQLWRGIGRHGFERDD